MDAPRPTNHAGPSAAPVARAPTASFSESGWAQFFTDTAIPNPTAGNNTCTAYFPSGQICYNLTTEPSLNLTSDGYTGLAYTAFTNASPCAAQAGNATTEVGWVVSTDFGLTWSSPVYLGNPVCSGVPDANYSSAFEPSLTSLANGTFVLTYVEYNSTAGAYPYSAAPPTNMLCGYTQNSRIVVTESYDHGHTWTTPAVVDGREFRPAKDKCPLRNFVDVRPRATAVGDTVYLTWSNVSSPLENYYFPNKVSSAWVHFATSTDGGRTWSSVPHLRVVDSTYNSEATDLAINPTVLVDPAGAVYVAYATQFGASTACLNSSCATFPSASILVARSIDNGSTFSYSTAASNVLLNNPSFYPYVYWDPMPALAYNPVFGQVYLSFSAVDYGNFCLNQGLLGRACGDQGLSKVFFENSSDAGTSWSTPQPVASVDPSAPWLSPEINPSMAVDRDGKVHLQYTVWDDSVCIWSGGPYGTPICSPVEQRYVNSSDNGTAWTTPLLVSWDTTLVGGPVETMWLGTYTSTLAAGREVLLGWTRQECVSLSNGCYQPAFSNAPALPPDYGEVVTSRLYTSAGLTITFNESGLPHGLDWSVNIQGNLRTGPAGTNLSVSGVPPSLAIVWNNSWINASYGDAYSATPSTAPPTAFATNATVVERYQEQVLVNLLVVPPGYTQQFVPFRYISNVDLTPDPGAFWTPAGTPQTFTQSYVAINSDCYACLNLTFQSWSGTGMGSLASNATSITFTPTGPVNETANFQVNGICWGAFYVVYGYPSCTNYSYSIDFQETGLPAGTNWSVSVLDPSGVTLTESTGTTALTFIVGPGPVDFRAWTLPDPGSGESWVPSASTGSPLQAPFLGTVTISYALEPLNAASFPTRFEAAGLPNGVSWALELGPDSYGVAGSNATIALTGGSSPSVNGTLVYLPNGTGYFASSIRVTPYVANESPSTLAPGGAFRVDGSSLVVVQYSPMYRLTVTGSVGGTVSPGSQWVRPGTSILLHASTDPGFLFVGWTGTGTSSVSTIDPNPLVAPQAVVTEFATFRSVPLPAWNLTLQAIGLPAGTPYSLTVAGTTFSGSGTFTINNVTAGSYPTSVPVVIANATTGERFVATDVASSLPLLPDGTLDVEADGVVTITFATQYALTLGSTPGGIATWGASGATGTGWFLAGTQVTLIATPRSGHVFVGWNGSGNGARSGNPATIVVTMNGPISETAQFQTRSAAAPATYSLAVTETGLPAGTPWSVIVNELVIAGTNATLTVPGLNGTYGVTAAAVYGAPGVRWQSDARDAPVAVPQQPTYSVSYSEEFQVTVFGAIGGSVTPAGVQWVAAAASLELDAVPSASHEFLSWTGSGNGSFSGPAASVSVTVTGPITEQAAFGPVPSTRAALGPLDDAAIAVGLLIVGIAIGILYRRRRTNP